MTATFLSNDSCFRNNFHLQFIMNFMIPEVEINFIVPQEIITYSLPMSPNKY